jgi:hypothetical protein
MLGDARSRKARWLSIAIVLGLEVARCDLALGIAVVRSGVGHSRDDDDGSGGGDRDLDKTSHDSLLGTRGKRSKALTTL